MRIVPRVPPKRLRMVKFVCECGPVYVHQVGVHAESEKHTNYVRDKVDVEDTIDVFKKYFKVKTV
jgi:hypothetical protein